MWSRSEPGSANDIEQQLLLGRVDGHEVAKPPSMMASFIATLEKRLELTTILLNLIIALGPACADVLTDYGSALPALFLESIERFCMQLALLTISSLLGGLAYIFEHKVYKKLRVERGLMGAVSVGICLAFPLFPFSVLLEGIIAWMRADQIGLKECLTTVPIIVACEVLESVFSLALQGDAAYDGVPNLEISLLCGFMCTVKAAVDQNTHKKIFWSFQLHPSQASDLDKEIPIIKGPLPGLTWSIWRTVILVVYHSFDLLAGLAAAIAFHDLAHDAFAIELATLGHASLAWMAFLGMQFFLQVFVMHATLPAGLLSQVVAAGTGCFFTPLPVVDEHVCVTPYCIIRFLSQTMVFALFTAQYSSCLVTTASPIPRSASNEFIMQVLLVASISMWTALIVIRRFASVSTADGETDQAIETTNEFLRSEIWHLPDDLVSKVILMNAHCQRFLRHYIDKGVSRERDANAREVYTVSSPMQSYALAATMLYEPPQQISLSIGKLNRASDPEICARIKEINQVASLSIGSGCKIGPKGCAHIKEMTQVASLSIGGQNNIGPEGCAHIKEMTQVASLSIGGQNNIGPEGCGHIKEMTQVASLSIGGHNKIGPEGCAHIKEMTQVTSLSIGDENNIRPEGCAHIKEMTQVASLSIGKDNHIGPEGCAHIKEMIQVTKLSMRV